MVQPLHIRTQIEPQLSYETKLTIRHQRFHLDIRTGAGGVDYEKVAKREQLEGLALQIRRLNDRLADAQNEQAYQKV